MPETLFDAFFKRIAKAAGIDTQAELAAVLGVHRSAVTQAKKKGVAPQGWILRLSRRYGLDPDWLEHGVGAALGTRRRGAATRPDAGSDGSLPPETDALYAGVPKVRARLCAGGGSFETSGDVEGFYSFRRDFLRRKGTPEAMVLMDVVGASMEPEIKHGDMALIDQSQTDVLAHAVYAVGVDDTVMIKRVEKQPGVLVLLSDNKEYSPIRLCGEEADSLRIIGRVLWISREL